MKKIVGLMLISILFLSVFTWSGCSKPVPTTDQNGQQGNMIDDSPMNLTYIGASATGPGLIIMNGLAECVSKSYPDSVITIIPGNFGTNVTRINNGEADAAISDTFFAKAAADGVMPFDKTMDNVASVAHLYPSSVHLIADKDLGIDSFEEIINNKMKLRISVGLAGGSSDICFQQLMEEYALTSDDFKNWGGEILNQNIDTSVQMMTDNRIDVMVMRSFVPTQNIQELSKNKDIVLLKIEPKVIKNMCEKYGYFKSTIATEAYDFLTEDSVCLNSNTIFVVPKNSSEENVYKITRSICENLEYLQSIHSAMAGMTAEDLVTDLGIPLHPGAEKYYKEAGILK